MKTNMPQKGPDVNVPSAGYPQTDINKDGIWVKGKYPAGTGTKTHVEFRGAGAAQRGKKFLLKNLTE